MNGIDIDLKVGELKLNYYGQGIREAAPSGGQKESAESFEYELTDGHAWSVIIAVLNFESSSEVQLVQYIGETPQCLHHLKGRRRMNIYEDVPTGRDFVELSQARIPADAVAPWSHLCRATEAQLNQGARFHVGRLLRRLGTEYGTRGEILGETNRRRGYLCAALEEGDHRGPLVAFVVTRVLALLNADNVEG